MIFTVSFKTPDALYNSIRRDIFYEVARDQSIAIEDKDEETEVRFEEQVEICSKWIEYGECISVRIDTGKKTIEVINCG